MKNIVEKKKKRENAGQYYSIPSIPTIFVKGLLRVAR